MLLHCAALHSVNVMHVLEQRLLGAGLLPCITARARTVKTFFWTFSGVDVLQPDLRGYNLIKGLGKSMSGLPAGVVATPNSCTAASFTLVVPYETTSASKTIALIYSSSHLTKNQDKCLHASWAPMARAASFCKERM